MRIELPSIWSLIVLIFLPTTTLVCQDLSVARANTLYENESYGEAIEIYEGILAEGQASAALHFNLANAYSKINQKGKSMLHYERALVINPADPSITHNRDILKGRLDTEISEIPDFFLLRYWRAFTGWLSSGIWSVLHLLLLGISVFVLYRWLMSDDLAAKKRYFGLFIASLLLSLMMLVFAYSRYTHETSQDRGVVMISQALQSNPDGKSEVLLQLSEGVKIKILDKIEDWYKVQLEDKEIGWIKENSFEVI